MTPPTDSSTNEVRQAHLPGNYELYDDSSGEQGPAICKLCWEVGGERNPAKLDTVWVSENGSPSIWWLCGDHVGAVRSGSANAVAFARSVSGVVKYPDPRGGED